MSNPLEAIKSGAQAFWNELTDHSADMGITASNDLIQIWYDIYRGKPSWQDYTFIGLKGVKQTRQRKTLNAGKFICKELCSLIWTERPKLTAPTGVIDFLNNNNFWQKSEEYSEYGAALGGYVYKLYAEQIPVPVDHTAQDDDEIGVLQPPKMQTVLKLDYIKADRFIPISWDSRGITEANFISDYVYKNRQYKIVEEHRKPTPDTVMIEKKVYCNDRDGMKRVDALSVGVDDMPVVIQSKVPLFAYVRFPEANNLQPDTPLGISMYANSLDTIETLDKAFDNLQHEIETSRRKIILPAEMVDSYFDKELGKSKLKYNPDEEVYVAFNSDDAKGMTPIPIDFQLRITDITASIQTALNILSIQSGFSSGYLTFDSNAQAITATQVVSEQSKTFKTKCKYENVIDDGMKQLIAAIQEIGQAYGLSDVNGAVSIQWNDNVIEDRNAKTDYWIKRYQAKTCTLADVLIAIDDMDEEKAKAKANEIMAENATMPDISTMFGGN